MTDHVRRGITVITHDGMTLPSIQDAQKHYGGVCYRTIIKSSVWEGENQLRVLKDPRNERQGVRCVLPDGTTYSSLKALSRAVGLSRQSLSCYIERREEGTAYFRSLSTEGDTQVAAPREKTEGGHAKVVYLGQRDIDILHQVANARGGCSLSAALRAVLRDYAAHVQSEEEG